MLSEDPPLPFCPTRPPPKEELELLSLPETVVVTETSPVAYELVMAPVFSPASPPMMVLLPPKTFPLAKDPEITRPEPLLELLLPTRPPAKFNPPPVQSVPEQSVPSCTVTCTAALEPVMVPMLKPTSPPALRPD